MSLRIGIFGGAFNPVHDGHLQAARSAQQVLDLRRVIFVPTGVPPFKDRSELLDGEQRVAMLRLAIADQPDFDVSDFEVQRADRKSYTIDTVRHLVALHPPGTEFFFLLGDDVTAKLPQWRGIDALQSLVRFACVHRHGVTPAAAEPALLAIAMPPIDISSTDIRSRLRAGSSIRGLTPPAVVDYIERHALYRDAPVHAVAQEDHHGR